MNRLVPRARRAVGLFELLLVLAIVMVALGVFLSYLAQARQQEERAKLTRNLKNIGIAMHNHAFANNGNLPDCSTKGGKNGPEFFSNQLPGAGKAPTAGLITFMENDFKVFQSESDPNLGDLGQKVLSYAVPLSWSQQPYNGKLNIPATFNFRGTSNSVGCVEATCGKGGTKLVSGTSITYNSAKGPDPFPTPVGPWSGNANSFREQGCMIQLMDGSVRNVSQKQAKDFINCSLPSNITPVSKDW